MSMVELTESGRVQIKKLAAQLRKRISEKEVVQVLSGIVNAFAKKHFKVSVPCFESENGDGYSICLKTGTVSRSLFS